MVVLVDLNQDELNEPFNNNAGHDFNRSLSLLQKHTVEPQQPDYEDERPNPNVNAFSQALGSYPVVSLLAQYLDLNSLHDLSRTCRQFRANLLQYRRQLISLALRCEHDEAEPGQILENNARDMHQNRNTYGPNGVRVSKISNGKVGACARDMVGECRKCSKIVCRNCIVKAPPQQVLKGRHRRLCRTCIKSPLDEHTRYAPVHECATADDTSSSSSSCSSSDDGSGDHIVFVARDACSCDDQVWICQPCGQSLRTNDTTYMRGWTWRTRYSAYLGGLGTGIGEGVEGVQCGRHSECLAAKGVEKEIDCDAEGLRAMQQLREKAELEGRTWSGTSYLMQEMEGIGGVVKKKVKKRVRVGAVVKEYEDEREHGKFMRREQDGLNRSWCSWCDRIVLGKKDHEAAAATAAVDEAGLQRTVSGSSSGSSV